MSAANSIRVLAGKRKPDTYLFISADAGAEDLPADLLSLLGELRAVSYTHLTLPTT